MALAPAASARGVRVFAMQPKLDLAWMQSRETFHDKMFALADRRLRAGAPPIQAGAEDFASHLRGPSDGSRPVETARDLVAWPEDVGLLAALTGERAAPARNSGSFEGAILTLISLYGSQVNYYRERFPDANRGVPTRLLGLALTDTFAHVAVETFAEMADRYDVWLEAGVNMAQSWRVVCRDRAAFNAASPPRLPAGVPCDEENPMKVSQLGDPFDPDRDYVYEATVGLPSNMALVFDPNGRLVSKQVKTYLTPPELPGQLDLVPGAVTGGLSAVETPVGTLGFVTSKDAWMPDVLQKLDQRHVDVLVQPEFFAGNLVAPTGMWSPDTLRASGYNDVLRHPSIETLVLPEMVGNVFNFSADAQSHIVVEPRRSSSGSFLVGQPPAPGMVGVLPWVVPDPARPGEPFDERRARLGEAGMKLAPGSGVACPDPSQPGPCENGHPEGVLFRDVEVDRRSAYRRYRGGRAKTAFSAARPVRRSRNPQRNAALAMEGRRGVLAYEERRGDDDQIYLVRTSDGGRTWSKPVRPTGRPRGATDEWTPTVAISRTGLVTVAWVDRSTGVERVYFARSRNGGRTFAPPSEMSPQAAPDVAQWAPDLAQGRGDRVHAVLIDERDLHVEDRIPQARMNYGRIQAGNALGFRDRDTGLPARLAAKLDNSWAPNVEARGSRVLITWLDFLNYDWDVFARVSKNEGDAFRDQQPVNDTPEDDPATTTVNEQAEALNDTPRAAIDGRGHTFVAWTDWRKRDSSATAPHQAYDTFLAQPGGPNLQIDPYGERQLSTFSPDVCATGRRDLLVAFQDASRGQNDIRIVRVRGGATPGRARRVDDAGPRAGNAWRPRLACSDGRVLAAWEDERDGPAQIYFARARASRIR